LWAAKTPNDFDFAQFSSGDFVGALAESLTAETITRVLYPDDHTTEGKGLRFLQEYFLVACSLADLVRRFRAAGNDWSALPDKVAIQLNDTHPTLAVPELMRLLVDEARLNWDDAWNLTQRRRLHEPHIAAGRWRNGRCSGSCPRHLEVIRNQSPLDDVARYIRPRRRVSLIGSASLSPVRLRTIRMRI
jgi:starch phosphorylase